ncbi:MAG: CAP domain-containing protein [Christensenellaceae bacterium]|jgi:uncharacterized protein YkwD|nr:CAP domain-containing protein [Christensenellaceae bacterium]
MFLPKTKKLVAAFAAVLILVFGGIASAAEQPCQFGRTRPASWYGKGNGQQQSCNQPSYGSTVAAANANYIAACPLPTAQAGVAAANSCANAQGSQNCPQNGICPQNGTACAQNGLNCAQSGAICGQNRSAYAQNSADCAQNGARQACQPAQRPAASQKPAATQAPSTQPSQQPVSPAPSAPAQQPSAGMDAYAQEVVRQVNEERAKQGLGALAVDANAVAAASVRTAEIAQSFSHTRPNGSDPFTALKEAGASYRGAGENIAKGQQSAERVMAAWMSSPGHYANIMKASYTKIGVAHAEIGGVHYWAQFFMS